MREMEVMHEVLLQEVKRQLGKIVIDHMDETIQKGYINLGTSFDMHPFVDIIGDYYHIKVCERREVVYDYATSNVNLAAYVILEDYTYRREFACLEDRFKYSRNTDVEAMIREMQEQYFKAFDEIYLQYFEKEISILNLDNVD
nr:hypothetical protein [Eubacterium sp.]